MDFILSPDGSLATLALAAFLAATLLPFPSEAALFAVLRLHPELLWPAIIVATLANTAGGMTNYLIGRAVDRALHRELPAQLARVSRWGAPVTALGWLPVVGEALCFAAGWLRLEWRAVVAWQLAGRGARYWVIAQGISTF
jgi:membrane protein YqaA with SNARE-associated domain